MAALVLSFADAAALTPMAQKLLRGRTIQCDFGFPYYAGRSAASIADEIEVNGFTGVYYFVGSDKATRRDIIAELQKRGIPVAAMVIASGAYLPIADRPSGWEKWRMEFTHDAMDGYQFMSYVHKDYAEWMKHRVVKLINDYGFDGFTFAEAMYPIADGLERETVLYGDVSPAFQQAFRHETGQTVFPEFVDRQSPFHYQKIPAVYQSLVDYRVKTIVDFYDEVINGRAGVREQCPGKFVATWTLGINQPDGVTKLREWEGNDIPAIIRRVRPDMHFVQTHAPDWMSPALPPDYARAYKPFFDAVRNASPGLPVGFQGDFVSHVEIRRDPEWVRRWHQACTNLSVESTTWYEFSLRWEVYHEPPKLRRVRQAGPKEIVLSFDQRLADECQNLAKGQSRVFAEGGRSYEVQEARVDGNLLALTLDGEPSPGELLALRLDGLRDDPNHRFERQGPVQPMSRGEANPIAAGVEARLRLDDTAESMQTPP